MNLRDEEEAEERPRRGGQIRQKDMWREETREEGGIEASLGMAINTIINAYNHIHNCKLHSKKPTFKELILKRPLDDGSLPLD